MRLSFKKFLIVFVSLLIIISILSLTIGTSIVEGKQPTLASFSIINFSGYLFFLLMPVEILIPYYLAENYSGLVLLFIAVISALIAQILDYSFGFLFSEEIVNKLVGRWKFNKAQKTIEKYGDWAIFLFNLLPLSSPLISLAAGMIKYNMRKFLMFSLAGLVIKYLYLVLIFRFF